MASTITPVGARPFQVVVWGATGFTGRLVAEHIARDYQGKIKWAIAGRDSKKLEQVRTDLVKINADCKDVPILVADASDKAAVGSMLGQTKVVVSTAGPFALYGDNIVEQSVLNGTHYCDITGELIWVRRCRDKWHKEAEEKKVKIVHCCGYDSVPADMGTLMMVDHIKKKLGKKTKKVYALMAGGKGGVSGGTIASAMNMMATEALSEVRKSSSDAYYLAGAVKPPGSDKPAPFNPTFIPPANSWAGPFVMEGVNGRIVHLSNALAAEPYGSDFSYCEMTKTGSGWGGWLAAQATTMATAAIGVMILLPPMRALLKRFLPSPGQGPSLENQRVLGFWKYEYYAETEEAPGVAPTIVKGTAGDKRDPGYWGTSRMILETALAIALDEEKIAAAGARPGGVLTPATAVGLPLLDRLRGAGLTFEVQE